MLHERGVLDFCICFQCFFLLLPCCLHAVPFPFYVVPFSYTPKYYYCFLFIPLPLQPVTFLLTGALFPSLAQGAITSFSLRYKEPKNDLSWIQLILFWFGTALHGTSKGWQNLTVGFSACSLYFQCCTWSFWFRISSVYNHCFYIRNVYTCC